jgi:hypothetical protein
MLVRQRFERAAVPVQPGTFGVAFRYAMDRDDMRAKPVDENERTLARSFYSYDGGVGGPILGQRRALNEFGLCEAQLMFADEVLAGLTSGSGYIAADEALPGRSKEERHDWSRDHASDYRKHARMSQRNDARSHCSSDPGRPLRARDSPAASGMLCR